MKYDRKKLQAENSKQTVLEGTESERVYLFAGAAACVLSLLIDVASSENFARTTGVAIGVAIAAVNYRLWKVIVANLIASSVERSTRPQKTFSPFMVVLLGGKLALLGVLLAAVFRINAVLVLPTLVGIMAHMLGGTLLILLISYNKR